MSTEFKSVKDGLNQAIKHASHKGRVARIHRPAPVSVKKSGKRLVWHNQNLLLPLE